MRNLRAGRGILSEGESSPVQDGNNAFERMPKEKVRYRCVADLQSLKNES